MIAPLSGVISLEEEFILELIDNLYNGLKRCLAMVLKGSKTPFESMKTILTRAIENVKNADGAGQTGPLEQLIENFEKDEASGVT